MLQKEISSGRSTSCSGIRKFTPLVNPVCLQERFLDVKAKQHHAVTIDFMEAVLQRLKGRK